MDDFVRAMPDWLRTGIIVTGYGIGFRLGWWWLDQHLEKRRARREAQMRNVTPQ